jgi:hypothetical protein
MDEAAPRPEPERSTLLAELKVAVIAYVARAMPRPTD